MFVGKKVKFLEKIFPERTFVITTSNTTRYLHLSTPMQIVISCCLLGLFAYGTRAYIKYNSFENKMIVKENENLKMENAQYHKYFASVEDQLDKIGAYLDVRQSVEADKKISNDIYRINREIKFTVPTLTPKRKEILTELYLRFKDLSFTCKEVLAAIEKSESTVLDALRTFELQNLLECKKAVKPYRYRLLVDPESYPSLFVENFESLQVSHTSNPVIDEKTDTKQHDSMYSNEVYELIETLATSDFSTRDRRLGTVMQQCIEKGTLFRSDYDDWGYTENMWSIDTELAVQLGLIRKESQDSYSLNKKLRPELRPTQKKTLTAIYEAFGCDEFSSDMFIATLNYSVSYTYASLHKLTLLRLLDQNIDENGNRYRLVVTPEENPECFDPAA